MNDKPNDMSESLSDYLWLLMQFVLTLGATMVFVGVLLGLIGASAYLSFRFLVGVLG